MRIGLPRKYALEQLDSGPEMIEMQTILFLTAKQKTNNLKPDVAHCQYP